MSEFKPTICLDWDGVICNGPHGRRARIGPIIGELVPGFFEWAEVAQRQFQLAVYSSRSATVESRAMMEMWIVEQLKSWSGDPIILHFPSEMPAAWVRIDDRAVQFR